MTNKQVEQKLHSELQNLDDQFSYNFAKYYHNGGKLFEKIQQQALAQQLNHQVIKKSPGNFLLLLGKMYLYDILPKGKYTGYDWNLYKTQSKLLLAYFYLKISAEKYSNPQAYYFLALLDYYKINPHSTVLQNLQKQIKRIQIQEGYQKVYQLQYLQLLEYLKNHRFFSVQHNLYLSSLLGHTGSKLVLANMNKQGLGMEKNCTTALSYYLSAVKQTYIDFYQYRSSYSDQQNLEKELYAKKQINFGNQENANIVSESQFFDTQTIKATYELAQHYFIGSGGFKKNYQKAAQLYTKLAAQDHKSSMAMLGLCFFKGQGTPLDRKKAKILFQSSTKVSISQAMLIVMDYFEIQSKGNRQSAIKKMKDIYEKKKDYMNPILKYLYGTLIVKGDIKDVKVDEGIILLGTAAKQGHLMAKIGMALLFSDGIDVNYDCKRAIDYFSQQATSYTFFMDKFYLARTGLKNNKKIFSFIKYLELTLVGDTNAFINTLYLLQIQKKASLQLNQKSWDIELSSQSPLYIKLKNLQIIPQIYSFFSKQFNFAGKNILKFRNLQVLLKGNQDITDSYYKYLKKKIIKVCAVTKQNSLMNFYEYKTNGQKSLSLLNSISNGQPSKLHVLQSRYLLGQYYHNKSFESLMKGADYTKQQYKAFQEYKRATNSKIIGSLLFYLQQIILNPIGIDYENQLFKFDFINDFLTYTLILTIIGFVLYYKRSKKLDQIHQKQLEKIHDQQKIKKQHQRIRLNQEKDNQQSIKQNKKINIKQELLNKKQEQKIFKQLIKQQNQPQIIQDQQQSKGIRIGSSFEEQKLIIVQNYINEEKQQQQIQNRKQR